LNEQNYENGYFRKYFSRMLYACPFMVYVPFGIISKLTEGEYRTVCGIFYDGFIYDT
jgi:hypothetical protein